MDLKVLGKNQTKIGKYVYIFDCIDIATRTVYSAILDRLDELNIMKKPIKCIYFSRNKTLI